MDALNHKPGLFKEKYYLTDGGLETTLIFHRGLALKSFAAFELLRSDYGEIEFLEYYTPYLSLSEKNKLGFVIESPTWRASCDWGVRLGYTHDELFALNRQSIKLIRHISRSFDQIPHVIISGNIGPRGDGYKADFRMTAEQAKAYHMEQVKAFAMEDADVVTAARLTGGESLREAIEKVDHETDYYAEHFMINCAHPHHFIKEVESEGEWKWRIGGIRANASLKSHAELDESETLDTGDKCLLAQGYAELFDLLPNVKVIGGCCGTDHSHLEEIYNEVFTRVAR